MEEYNWCVLCVRPRQTEHVIGKLAAREVEYFYPEVLAQRSIYRHPKLTPCFMGYLFVNLEGGNGQAGELRQLAGVRGWLTNGGQMVVIPNTLLAMIRQKILEVNTKGGMTPEDYAAESEALFSADAKINPMAIFNPRLSGYQRLKMLVWVALGAEVYFDPHTKEEPGN